MAFLQGAACGFSEFFAQSFGMLLSIPLSFIRAYLVRDRAEPWEGLIQTLCKWTRMVSEFCKGGRIGMNSCQVRSWKVM